MSNTVKMNLSKADYSAIIKAAMKLDKSIQNTTNVVGEATNIFNQWAALAPELLAGATDFKPMAQANLFPDSDWAVSPKKPKPEKMFSNPGSWQLKDSWYDPPKAP